jgi:hypothetical protein
MKVHYGGRPYAPRNAAPQEASRGPGNLLFKRALDHAIAACYEEFKNRSQGSSGEL